MFAGSLSQPVLTQPPSLSASLGASARLTCTLSSGFSVGGYRIYWHQQKPGSPPRYLLNFSSKHQGSGVPSRFSGSKDGSVNAGLLLISGLQPEDEADYYCSTWHGNSGTHTVLQSHGEVRLKALLCSSYLRLSPFLCLGLSNSGGISCHFFSQQVFPKTHGFANVFSVALVYKFIYPLLISSLSDHVYTSINRFLGVHTPPGG